METLPVTRTPFFPMLDNNSSFLDLIFAYISLLNLVVISARRKHLLKKKKNPSVYKRINTDEHNTNELNTYSFFLQCRDRAERRETGRDQGYRRQRFANLLGRPNFQSLGRIYRLLNTLLMPAFELRPSLNCTKQEANESVMVTANTTKLETTKRNTDAPKVGVPHRRSNPNPCWRESQNRPRT